MLWILFWFLFIFQAELLQLWIEDTHIAVSRFREVKLDQEDQ